ncbi:hypothetical protein ACGFXC_27065 [Streptomyces sp. NPDC048507]|uniref:hypothetical protein n=1 Tax=Streptomyces sp. NPDC048507 TaxID=3365560 RepID=UPI0037183828
METNAHTTATTTTADATTTADPALLDGPGVRAAFGRVRAAVKVYGVLTSAALLTVVAVAGTGHLVNPFMWIRAILLPLVAVLLHRLARSAAGGARRPFERLRGVSAVFPVAIVGVDLIPGVCPWWYAALQALCVLPVARVALTLRGAALRAVFAPLPKTR